MSDHVRTEPRDWLVLVSDPSELDLKWLRTGEPDRGCFYSFDLMFAGRYSESEARAIAARDGTLAMLLELATIITNKD